MEKGREGERERKKALEVVKTMTQYSQQVCIRVMYFFSIVPNFTLATNAGIMNMKQLLL